jgi:hypothetical protein
MKKIVSSFFAIVLIIYSPAWFAEENMTGLEIMQRVQDRYVGEDFRALVEMVLVSKSGKEKKRKLLLFRKDYGDDSKTLFKFIAPKQLKNTGLLIHTFAETDNLQWLYLSSSRKKEARKIPAAKKDGSFIGSEFYYVDLEEVLARDFEHKLLREEQYEQYSSYVVESIPKKEDYPYSKVIIWVDKKTDVAVKLDAYKKGKLLKTISITKMEKINNIQTAMETLVVNHKNGKKSMMIAEKVKYNTKLKDSMFTANKMVQDL